MPASISKQMTMITQLSFNRLPDSNQKLDAMLQAFGDLLFILDHDGTILDYKASDVDQLYVPASKFLKRKMYDVLPLEAGKKFKAALSRIQGTKEPIQIEYSLPSPSGDGWYESRLLSLASGQIIAFVRDITNYKRSQSKVNDQLEQLAALRSIDQAISSGVDLHLTLSVILEHVRRLLNIDAASVLLLNSHTGQLEFAAATGFTTPALRETRLRLGEGYAGRAALEQKAVHIAELDTQKTDFFRSIYMKNEKFVEYYAFPLIAKGQVLGVLEIFHRSSIHSGDDWLNFANTLAGQTAIAIDNAMLFKNLQQVNTELTIAYDRTIEGWARALHLRDSDTEMHTRRVTEMTMNLARRIGINDVELPDIRRGAILHDIGKVAIPDSILLKPDVLDEDEWIMMRQHPLIAVELLQPVPYLTSALAIPRSHHEKWDGSGYPDGLQAEQIPIAARIFTIVDVFDALTSDRPYRSAWLKQEALDYIREQAGRHFDPSLVPIFMEMTK